MPERVEVPAGDHHIHLSGQGDQLADHRVAAADREGSTGKEVGLDVDGDQDGAPGDALPPTYSLTSLNCSMVAGEGAP